MSINQVIKAAQAFSDSKTAALKKSLDAERKDKEELKRLNQQLIGEVQQLQRQLKDAKDQHEEWRVKYSKALSEKIALLRPHEVSHACWAMYLFWYHLQPNPILPLEVLAIIAGFAAGANDYAGVAAMCATSQLMQAELKPVLYETVIWNSYFRERLHGSLNQLDAPEFRHIRYVCPRNMLQRLTWTVT
jgi:hypothetical protein